VRNLARPSITGCLQKIYVGVASRPVLQLRRVRRRFAAGGDLNKVKHVIVIMQENHSFDNYFGALAYAPGTPYHSGRFGCRKDDHACVDGLTCKVNKDGTLTCFNANREDNGKLVFAFHDHTSILAFIEKRFMPIGSDPGDAGRADDDLAPVTHQHLTKRDQNAHTLEDMFDFDGAPSSNTPITPVAPPTVDCTPH
jgi:Phosphoesterase family